MATFVTIGHGGRAGARGASQPYKLSAMRDLLPRKGEGVGREVSPPTIGPVLVAELLAKGERMPARWV
jgi:hypothetical protein